MEYITVKKLSELCKFRKPGLSISFLVKTTLSLLFKRGTKECGIFLTYITMKVTFKEYLH
jgi:hypothetical protein